MKELRFETDLKNKSNKREICPWFLGSIVRSVAKTTKKKPAVGAVWKHVGEFKSLSLLARVFVVFCLSQNFLCMSLPFRKNMHQGSASRCPTGQNIKKKLSASVIPQIAALHVTSLPTERATLTLLTGSQTLTWGRRCVIQGQSPRRLLCRRSPAFCLN